MYNSTLVFNYILLNPNEHLPINFTHVVHSQYQLNYMLLHYSDILPLVTPNRTGLTINDTPIDHKPVP